MNKQLDQSMQDTLTIYRNDYIATLSGSFDNLENQILFFTSIDSYNTGRECLFRDVHNLKGTAGTYDLQIISTICHQLEDQIAEYSDDIIKSCLQYIDLLRASLERASSYEKPIFDDIQEKLYNLQKHNSKNQLLCALVDPSRSSSHLINGLLKGYPIKLTIMTDGLVALSRLLFVKYDLIIVSKELPSLDGVALVNALRETNCSNRTTKTLLISSTSKVRSVPFKKMDVVTKDSNFSKNMLDILSSMYPELTTQKIKK